MSSALSLTQRADELLTEAFNFEETLRESPASTYQQRHSARLLCHLAQLLAEIAKAREAAR